MTRLNIRLTELEYSDITAAGIIAGRKNSNCAKCHECDGKALPRCRVYYVTDVAVYPAALCRKCYDYRQAEVEPESDTDYVEPMRTRESIPRRQSRCPRAPYAPRTPYAKPVLYRTGKALDVDTYYVLDCTLA